jgi:hypothetical protein
MLNNTLRAGAVGAGAASRYGSGSATLVRREREKEDRA